MRRALLVLLVIPTLLFASEKPHRIPIPFGTEVEAGLWQGGVRAALDAASGRVCLEYREERPQGTADLTVEFPDPGLENYDALELEWKLVADDANVIVSLEGDPARPLRRFYLRKRPNVPGQWQKAYLSLDQDDDGAATSKLVDPPPAGKLRLRIALSLRDMTGSETPVLAFRLAEPRLVRYPVILNGSYMEVTPLKEEGFVGQRYTMTLRNRTDEPQSVHLGAETARLAPFALVLPPQPIALKAGEEKVFHADLRIPSEKAAELPALTSESAYLFAWTEREPGLKSTWFESYFLNPLIGSIPPAPRKAPHLVSETERAHALAKIASEPKARQLFENMEREADEWLELEIALPKLMHGYSGYYVCKAHSSPLQYRGERSHWCVKGEHLMEGDDADLDVISRAGAYQQHNAFSHAALNLARVGWLKKDARYSRKAAEILLAYAAIYPELPYFNIHSTGYHSRVAHAVLGECWWLDPIPYAFDLVSGAEVMSQEEIGRVRERLILPAVLAIRSHRNSANQQAETNHSVGLGALVAGHWPLASEAMDGEFGLRFQWSEDFYPDGMSIEHELPYHFAAVKPFVQMARAYRSYGLSLFNDAFRQLFVAPIAYSPDPLPDSYAAIYESVLDAWPEAQFFAQAAQHRRGVWGWSTLLNQTDPPAETPLSVGNTTLPSSGITSLRAVNLEGGVSAAGVNFGSSAWRGGKALLDPLLTWNGFPLNQRIFRIGYGYEGSQFSYTPAAGNALLVDGKGGSMLRADEDALLPFPAGRWTTPVQRPHFPGVSWSRSVVILGNTTILLDQFSADRPRRFDLIRYFPAALTGDPLGGEAYPQLIEEGDGYSYLRDPRRLLESPSQLRYPLGPKQNAPAGEALFIGEPSGSFVAEAQAEWHPRWIPALIQRFEGMNGWAAVAYSAGSDVGKVRIVVLPVYPANGGEALSPSEAVAFRVSTERGEALILSANKTATYKVDGVSLTGPLAILNERAAGEGKK